MLAAKLKSFAKDSVIYGLGDGLGRLISIVMLPILSRAFIPDDYGAIDLLSAGYGFIIIIVSLNIFPGLNKKYYSLTKAEQRSLTASTSFFLFIAASFFTLLLLLFPDPLSELIVHDRKLSAPIRVLALCLPIELFFNILQLLLRIQNKAVLFTATNVARVIITPLLTFYMVIIMHSGIIGVFYSKLISLTLLTTATFILERKQFSWAISFTTFQHLAAFTLPGYPGTLIKQCMDILPKFLLAAFAPLSAVGFFGIASRLSQLMSLYVRAFNRAWGPFAFAHAGKPEEKDLYSIIFKFFAFSLMLLGFSTSLFAREVLMLLTPPQYHSAHILVGGVVFYLGVRGASIMFGTVLYVVEQVKWISYLYTLQLIIFLIAALFLIPRYQTTGLIAALDIAITVYFACFMQVIMRYFKFDIPLVRLAVLLLFAAATVLFFISFNPGLILTLLCKIICFAGYGFLGFIFLLDKREKDKILKLCDKTPFAKNIIARCLR